MNECVNSENVGRVEELLAMTEQMQDELDQKDQTILELNSQLSESLTLNEKLNSENRAENIEALRTRLRQTEEQLTSETDSRKRADAEVVAWKFKYEKAEQAKRYAQTHQKTVEVSVEKKVPYEKCENCDRTAYQKAKEKCDNRKIQLEKKYKNMTATYESALFLLAWYSTATTLFNAIFSPVFFNDFIIFFGTIGKGIVNLFQEFVTGADSFGQLSNGISNSIFSGIVYWLIVVILMGDFIHNNRIDYSLDWLSGWKNLPEILLGYHQHHDGDNEYSYRNLLWRMDKSCHSVKSHCTAISGACGLYRNPMLRERLAGRTRILLRKNTGRCFSLPVFKK